eukprot:TRINITY_DN18359_c0_g1_i1.p1 TRINITY_DN18359_c0_g1~~TRINITY_DN18359_c0_g1_i1.p1  ORF type:complete len:545 (+),score=88.59 TRINITY_DN18359_c0_g1_i1:40-1635(+)
MAAAVASSDAATPLREAVAAPASGLDAAADACGSTDAANPSRKESDVWSPHRGFHLVHGLAEADKDLLIEPTSVTDAINDLNDGTISCESGLCIVYSESQEGYFVLFKREKQEEALARFWCLDSVGPAARLTAAKTVVSETMCILPALVRLYRFTEFTAQVLLLCLMTWIVNPWILAGLFLLFWYMPAVRRTGGYGKPIGYPTLNFCVDRYSLLSLHPDLRFHGASVTPWQAYRAAMLRVFILLMILPLLVPLTSPLPDSVLNILSHKETLDRISWLNKHAEHKGDLSIYAEDLWLVLSGSIVALSVLWLLIVVPMILLERCRRCVSCGSGAAGDSCRRLAMALEFASSQEPARCIEEMRALREERGHGKLRMTTAANTIGPAWAVLLHIGIDMVNIMSFAKSEDYARAVLLGLVVVITVCYANNLTTGGICSICHETRLSLSRGLMTDDYLAFIKADKGIQSIPSLIIILSGLPFKAKNFLATLGGMGSIVINVVLVVPFIYEQFDLVVETELEHSEEAQPEEVQPEEAA